MNKDKPLNSINLIQEVTKLKNRKTNKKKKTITKFTTKQLNLVKVKTEERKKGERI